VQKTILRSLNFEENLLESNESIEQTFKNYIDAKCVNVEGEIVECNIEEVDIEKNEETLPIYIRMNNEKIEGIALPIAGKGLWSTIFGYIALNPDTDSVLGIQFYKHGETPGLGGEVEKKWFTDNFVNHPIKESNGEITYVPKKIRNENGKIISISVIKGGVDYSKSNKSAIHQVDGISGATVTADGVSDFLLEDLLRYEKTLDKIRDYGTI
jgi:Na+-transporting NADH:ubiquinone oxidoreductase subunit C